MQKKSNIQPQLHRECENRVRPILNAKFRTVIKAPLGRTHHQSQNRQRHSQRNLSKHIRGSIIDLHDPSRGAGDKSNDRRLITTALKNHHHQLDHCGAGIPVSTVVTYGSNADAQMALKRGIHEGHTSVCVCT